MRARPCARLTFLPQPVSWVYESGLANFCQRLFSQQKPQNPAGAGAFCQLSPVLGQDERPTVAEGRQTGFPHAANDGSTQESGEICLARNCTNPGARTPVVSAFPVAKINPE